jgi:hypothetical protein
VELAELFTVATETLAKLVTELVTELVSRTELLIKLTSGTELEAQVEIQQPEELEMLLVAIHY